MAGKKDVLVVVEWVDACYVGSRQMTAEEAAADPLVLLRSAGWLIRVDREMVVLATDLFQEASPTEYRHVHAIPRVNVRRVIRLRA